MSKIKTKTTTRRVATTAKRVHFSVSAIRNANPRGYRVARKSGMLARIFSL